MRKFEEIIGKFPQIKQNRQAMTKIAFTSNIYREAFSMIGRGVAMAVKETGRVVNKAIHEWPYAFMFAEALVLVVIGSVTTQASVSSIFRQRLTACRWQAICGTTWRKEVTMSDYELINLTLDQIRRIAGAIELVRIEQWHLLKAQGEESISGKIMKDCYDKNEAALKKCRLALRNVLKDIAEHQNAGDMVSAVDAALSKVPFDLIYERKNEKDFEKEG